MSSGTGASSASSGSQTRIWSPSADLVRRLGRLAVDQDGVGVDDLLDHAPRVVGVPARQVRVDPLAHHPGLDDELGGSARQLGGRHRDGIGVAGVTMQQTASPGCIARPGFTSAQRLRFGGPDARAGERPGRLRPRRGVSGLGRLAASARGWAGAAGGPRGSARRRVPGPGSGATGRVPDGVVGRA